MAGLGDNQNQRSLSLCVRFILTYYGPAAATWQGIWAPTAPGKSSQLPSQRKGLSFLSFCRKVLGRNSASPRSCAHVGLKHAGYSDWLSSWEPHGGEEGTAMTIEPEKLNSSDGCTIL